MRMRNVRAFVEERERERDDDDDDDGDGDGKKRKKKYSTYSGGRDLISQHTPQRLSPSIRFQLS